MGIGKPGGIGGVDGGRSLLGASFMTLAQALDVDFLAGGDQPFRIDLDIERLDLGNIGCASKGGGSIETGSGAVRAHEYGQKFHGIISL
jgi:hypothetical protein